jgi:aldehyde dehydrogenase (NAD+)
MSLQAEALKGAPLIGGEWQEAPDSELAPSIDPASGEEVGRFARSSASDVDAAVAAAVGAREEWYRAGAIARGAVLERAADLLEARADEWAELMTREMGKPLPEAKGECLRAVGILRFYASEAQRPFGEHYESQTPRTWLFTRRRPVGVSAIITPWNFPAAIPAWKVAPALVFGNPVVLKLAEAATLTGLFLVRALVEAGLPDGVLNVLTGSGSELGPPLVTHPDVAAVSFTGSVAVGEGIREAAAARGKRVQLELGGHNPVIVRHDADLDLALSAVTLGAFASAGQKCTATRRVYAAEGIYERFVERLGERASNLRVGPGLDPSTEVGPLVDEGAMNGVLEALERASSDGRVVAGARRVTENGLERGCFVAPTVIADLPADAHLAREEVFGPAVAVWPYAEDDDAVALANRTEYGLSAAVFTSDLGVAMDFVERIEAGVVHVNSQTAGAEAHVPFGGMGSSGYGPHEQGRAAIEFYTEQQTVYMDRPQ